MLDPDYLDAIKKFEGYSAKARWDYAQNSNGYGTRARYAGEVIDKAEADRRFAGEIQKAADFVDKFAPDLDDGSKAALTSLTYNAGTAWAQSGLGDAIANGDMDKARSLFLQYNKAGGSVVDGLVQRRLQEVSWFGQGASESTHVLANLAQSTSSAPSGAAVSSFEPLTLAKPASVVRLARNDVDMPPSSTDRPFADLGTDPALLALLAHVGKSQPTRNSDENTAKHDVQIVPPGVDAS
ncbi:lysozyme [Hyphomicrobium sp.]|jgi:lysozyme|uniref:lysozyme n=1 Tax=Hyphomicrobium sp. TaxID=82 RepID=UPI002BAE517F|nr:lysozyme [Hyphomicrobium sp.]HVZ04367.1 lysozyme [Hyphomicrobium sp.]